jgi:hypothetical protein
MDVGEDDDGDRLCLSSLEYWMQMKESLSH